MTICILQVLIFVAMPAVAISKQRHTGALDRFLGPDTHVLNTVQQSITNNILVEWLDVAMPEDGQPEDRGMLYLFPIDDVEFCLQICFLQFEETNSINARVCSLQFLPAFFQQYPAELLLANQPFRFDESSEQQFPVCSQARALLTQLQNDLPATPFIKSLHQSQTAMHLLRRALECITIPFMACPVPACRFLVYESEREKINDARNYLEQNIDQAITIKELSRKVAMNECYLKKGFKAILGKTIHEYQQELRINKAKVLLQHHGLSVTEVANTLGYSSISHFSTAFKRITGLKPCELLA